MRLTAHHAAEIVQLAQQVAGMPVEVRVFGSRLRLQFLTRVIRNTMHEVFGGRTRV